MLEIKNTRTEIKNYFGGHISTLNTDEEIISELMDVSMENSKTEKQTDQSLKKGRREEQIIQGMWDNYRSSNKCIMGIPEEKRKQKEEKKYLKQ